MRILVTGAGAGLGAAIALRLQGAGHAVLAFDRKLGHDVRAPQATFGEVPPALDILINCAGVGPAWKVLGKDGPHPLDNFARTVNINLVGAFNMVRLAAAAMAAGTPNAEGERGVIVNTASVAAFEGQVGQAAYAASKAGVVGMTLPIARELARSGIRVNAIAPGLFLTPMMAALPQDVQDSLGKATPFPPRLGRPDEFAQLVRSIVENAMLNGEAIRLDGAVRLSAK